MYQHKPGCDALNDHGECVWPGDCDCAGTCARCGGNMRPIDTESVVCTNPQCPDCVAK